MILKVKPMAPFELINLCILVVLFLLSPYFFPLLIKNWVKFYLSNATEEQ